MEPTAPGTRVSPADRIKDFRFQPGVSGNPKGRPRKRPVTESHEDRLRSPLEAETRRKMKLPEGATQADAISWMLVEKAKRGDVAAAKELRESVEGKSVMRHEISSPSNRAWVVEVCYEPLPELSAPVIDLVADETLSDDETAIRLREQNAETIRKARESDE
jgi:Family of unknown function (DUF5681)